MRFALEGAEYTIPRALGIGSNLNSDVDPQGSGVGLTSLIHLGENVTDLSWDAGIVVEVLGIQIETTTTVEPITVETLPFTGLDSEETLIMALVVGVAGALLVFAASRQTNELLVADVGGWRSRSAAFLVMLPPSRGRYARRSWQQGRHRVR